MRRPGKRGGWRLRRWKPGGWRSQELPHPSFRASAFPFSGRPLWGRAVRQSFRGGKAPRGEGARGRARCAHKGRRSLWPGLRGVPFPVSWPLGDCSPAAAACVCVCVGGGYEKGSAARRYRRGRAPSRPRASAPAAWSSPLARTPKGLRWRDPGDLQPLSRLAARTARASRSPPAAAALAPASLLPSLPPASRPMRGHGAAAVAGRIHGSRPPPPCPVHGFPSLQPVGSPEGWLWHAERGPAGGGLREIKVLALELV